MVVKENISWLGGYLHVTVTSSFAIAAQPKPHYGSGTFIFGIKIFLFAEKFKSKIALLVTAQQLSNIFIPQ